MPGQRVLTLEMTSSGAVPVGGDEALGAASSRLPRGGYSTLRTWGGRGLVRLGAHVRRLEDSAARQGHPATIDLDAARRLVRAALEAGGHPESRLRLTFAPPRLFASVEAFVPPPRSRYEEGVACVTLPLHREQPRVKDTAFIPTAERAYGALPPDVEEGLLLADDGSILEGLSSNFFGVIEGSLRTEEDRVLPGITRALALEVAEAHVDVVRRAVGHDERALLGEAFVTSASRGVLPVVRIDDDLVADGRPGPHTRAIIRAFDALVRREAETV